MNEDRNCPCASNIECEATKCVYNENSKCSADQIHVGNQNACNSSETCCSTFVEK